MLHTDWQLVTGWPRCVIHRLEVGYGVVVVVLHRLAVGYKVA